MRILRPAAIVSLIGMMALGCLVNQAQADPLPSPYRSWIHQASGAKSAPSSQAADLQVKTDKVALQPATKPPDPAQDPSEINRMIQTVKSLPVQVEMSGVSVKVFSSTW